MAKRKAAKKSVNKSQAIKDYFAKHPGAGPTEVSNALKKQGISVTPAYVSSIKSSLKPTKRKSASKKKAADTTPAEDVMQAGQLMYQAVDLVMKAGYKEAKAMVDMAGKMVDRVRDEKK